MTEQQAHAQRQTLSRDENLTDEERAALRSLLDRCASQRRAAKLADHVDTEWPLPLRVELAIAASVERYIVDWAVSMRHDAERIEQRARVLLAEIDDAMRQLSEAQSATDDR